MLLSRTNVSTLKALSAVAKRQLAIANLRSQLPLLPKRAPAATTTAVTTPLRCGNHGYNYAQKPPAYVYAHKTRSTCTLVMRRLRSSRRPSSRPAAWPRCVLILFFSPLSCPLSCLVKLHGALRPHAQKRTDWGARSMFHGLPFPFSHTNISQPHPLAVFQSTIAPLTYCFFPFSSCVQTNLSFLP